jgi:hypothetical protein
MGLVRKEDAMKKMILATMVIGMTVSVALCQDMVDNPQYKSWLAFKVGTVLKMQMNSAMTMGDKEMVTKMTMTSTLKELTADKAVIEVVTEMDMNGTKTAMPAQKQEVPAKVAKGADSQPAGVTITKKGEGDEEVAVGDKKVKAHWVENEMTSAQMASTSKVWTSAEIPGGTVKMESQTTKPMASKTTSAVTEFKTGA